MTQPDVKIARTDEDVQACFPVMAELRPHLQRSTFPSTIREMEGQGCTLAFLSVDERPVAVAGYRVTYMLYCGRLLYVDDLVTTAHERSRGHGATLLAWLVERARERGCAQLHLDSGVQREDAHRFYKTQGLAISAFHFRIDVEQRVAD